MDELRPRELRPRDGASLTTPWNSIKGGERTCPAPTPTPNSIHADACYDDPRADCCGKRRTAFPKITINVQEYPDFLQNIGNSLDTADNRNLDSPTSRECGPSSPPIYKAALWQVYAGGDSKATRRS
jgi:hypothetical protein